MDSLKIETETQAAQIEALVEHRVSEQVACVERGNGGIYFVFSHRDDQRAVYHADHFLNVLHRLRANPVPELDTVYIPVKNTTFNFNAPDGEGQVKEGGGTDESSPSGRMFTEDVPEGAVDIEAELRNIYRAADLGRSALIDTVESSRSRTRGLV